MKVQLEQNNDTKVPEAKDTQTIYKPSMWERIIAIVCAITVVNVVLVLVLRERPFSDPNLVVLIRMVLSLAIAIIGGIIPGFLNISLKGKGATIRASGALALFVFTYIFSPKVAPNLLEKKMLEILDMPYIQRTMKNIDRPNRIDLFDIEYVNLLNEGNEEANKSLMHKLPSREKVEAMYRKKYEIAQKYDSEEYSDAEMQDDIENHMKSLEEMSAKLELVDEMKKTIVPNQGNRRKKLKVSYRMKYKGIDDLEGITIHFGLYDRNETRLDQYVYTRKWVRKNDILSEIVEIRTDNNIEVAIAKIDGILLDNRNDSETFFSIGSGGQ